MKIGFLTACMGKRSLTEILDFAAKEGFDALEVTSGHLGIDDMSKARVKELKGVLSDKGLTFSSIAHYGNMLAGDKDENAANLKKAIDAAEALGVDVVCALAGIAPEDANKGQVLQEQAAPFWQPVADYAADKGVKIAFENWYRTLIENLEHWRICFEAIGRDNVGLNFDPSHLFWQGIDYLAAVDMFKERIFHTHAKDTEIKAERLRILGSQSSGWWRYVIPGFGGIDWGVYVARLRGIGYEGVLSIEHEDGTFSVEEGLIKGRAYLALFA